MSTGEKTFPPESPNESPLSGRSPTPCPDSVCTQLGLREGGKEGGREGGREGGSEGEEEGWKGRDIESKIYIHNEKIVVVIIIIHVPTITVQHHLATNTGALSLSESRYSICSR